MAMNKYIFFFLKDFFFQKIGSVFKVLFDVISFSVIDIILDMSFDDFFVDFDLKFGPNSHDVFDIVLYQKISIFSEV